MAVERQRPLITSDRKHKSMEITKVEDPDDKTLIKGVTDDRPHSMMDDFLSGFGMSALSVKPASKAASNDVSDTKKTETPAQPAKVSLSLEEKQRLAREQEQQRFLKAQKPLDNKSSSPATKSQPKKQMSFNQPKDLTSSLMGSNLANMSNGTPNKPMSSYSTSGMSSMGGMGAGLQASSGMSKPNYSVNTSYTSPSIGGGSTFSSPLPSQNTYRMASNSTGLGSSGMSSGKPAQNKQMDMSAFDSLLPNNSNQSKMSVNQMVQGKSSQQGTMGIGSQGQMAPQGMMGNRGMMGTQSMMGQPGMMGGGFGGQTSMNTGFGGQTSMNSGFGGQTSMNAGFGGQTSMNAGFGGMNMSTGLNSGQQQSGVGMLQPAQGQGFMQPQHMGNTNMSSNQTQNNVNLDDLFG